MLADPPELVIRDLATLEDYESCVALQEEVWGAGFSERVPAAILRVTQELGGVTAGAFDADGTMLGFVFGITGVRDGELVHWSDMLAVREAARGRGVAEQLKRYQREKVRALGIRRMLWTYDPLVARNAHFNINRLGARPVDYVTDMYGSHTGSALHGELPTDRFVVEWDLSADATPAPAVAEALDEDADLMMLNPLDPQGLPGEVVREPSAGGGVRVQIPGDLREVQRAGQEPAERWRHAVRAAIVPMLRRGYCVTRFVRAEGARLPYYVLKPRAECAEE